MGNEESRHLFEKYYTDWHDVDEDSKTILYQGGYWPDGTTTRVGVLRRAMDYVANTTDNIVASLKKIKNSLSQ